MIVNDFENKKTLDTETGIYLTLTDYHGLERFASFDVIDNDVSISVVARRDTVNLDSGATTITYLIQCEPMIKGRPRRLNYLELISKLLQEFKFNYGPSPLVKGPTAVELKIDDAFVTSLQNWEVQNGK
jgi:hypothetical protein